MHVRLIRHEESFQLKNQVFFFQQHVETRPIAITLTPPKTPTMPIVERGHDEV
jgi:hypothetical protein